MKILAGIVNIDPSKEESWGAWRGGPGGATFEAGGPEF